MISSNLNSYPLLLSQPCSLNILDCIMPRKRVAKNASEAYDILWDLFKAHGLTTARVRTSIKAHLATFGDSIDNCLFCGLNVDEVEKYGQFIHAKCGISIHYFCLLFACDLTQSEDEKKCDIIDSSDAIYGFSIKDILLEFLRARKLQCSFCYKKGASVGCAHSNCTKKFHYPCGLKRKHLYQYYGVYGAHCTRHKPVQVLTKSSDSSHSTCGICFDAIKEPFDPFDVLTTPCCNNLWIHRKCVQKHALSFGLYLFRCPFCNNRDDFVAEMHRMGVYIPQRDASWETPGAFDDLMESNLICDVEKCRCVHGRDYDQPETIWSISACVLCNSSGAHVCCASLKSLSSPFVCDICKSVWAENLKAKLKDMGFTLKDTPIKRPISLINVCVEALDVSSVKELGKDGNADCGNGDAQALTRTLRPRISRIQYAKRRRITFTV